MKKYIIYFSLQLLAICSFAFNKEIEVVTRTPKYKMTTEKVILKNLVSETHFVGKYFSIYEGKSETPVTFDAPKELLLKAATTYYHLTKARDFFTDSLQSNYVKEMAQIKIRLDLINDFDEVGHFAHEARNPQYNNALTVPPGEGLEEMGVNAWAHEIWFRPSKKIAFDDMEGLGNQAAIEQQKLNPFRNRIHESSAQKFIFSTISQFRSEQANWQNILSLGNILSSGAIEFFYHTFPVINKTISPKAFYLESALVPEIIYHEFCHVALSNHLPTTHSKAVIEGVADYFAARIANHHKIGKKTKKYTNLKGKNGKNDVLYAPELETPFYANHDFVFALLWDINAKMGNQRTDDLLLTTCQHLNTSADIRNDLTAALVTACRSINGRASKAVLNLYQLLEKRGL